MKLCFNNKKKPLAYNIYKFALILIAALLILTYLYRNSSLFFFDDLDLPFSVHLNKETVYLTKGEEFKLRVYRINKRVTYSSTNFRVAGVNFNGRIRAHQSGKAFIIAKVDGRVLKCRVYVIDLNKDKLVLKEGDSYRLKIKGKWVFPEWESSNKRVVTVNMFGKVEAKKKGSAIIYAKVKGKVLKCKVIVK